MVLENKLGLSSSAELHEAEERLTKARAVEIFNQELLKGKKPGSFETLSFIHGHLFQDVYDFAGKLRQVDICAVPTGCGRKNRRYAAIELR